MRITKNKKSAQKFDQYLENFGSDSQDYVGDQGVVTAILGPTNTGKTHLAIERMLAYQSGMIGLPLRLLAREIYDRIVKMVGKHQVALITGEEKIIPSNPNYFVCTVEAMPRDLSVEFMAIDEIQIAADPQRGHIFTNRLLNYRGKHETMFLGSANMKPMLKRMLPYVKFIERPRFSTLSYAGSKKLSRLPRKTAIIAFSSDQVYEIAELIRRQKGGAAVVLGSLSPRTRNAQVALYQSGEVDYLVATDAVGMGLNLNIDHVAFAGTHKFDGQKNRHLTLSEMSQIAGRAGRYKNDGTFGITALVKQLDQDAIEAIENHEFSNISHLYWRNNRLDFTKVTHLLRSLNKPAIFKGLIRKTDATDHQTLMRLSKNEEIMHLARGVKNIKILWEVASIPDFRRVNMSDHATLVSHIYRNLIENGYIDEDWFAKQVSYSDNVDGDIDALSNRIAHIRTWTYVANRPDWVKNVSHWRQTTRMIENRLSDALHQRLMQRFVDKKTSLLMSRLREKEEVMTDVSNVGEVILEDQQVGKMVGLNFVMDQTDDQAQEKTLRSAAMAEVTQEVTRRVEQILAEDKSSLTINDEGKICWQEQPIATFEAGDKILTPYINLIENPYLSAADASKLLDFVKAWFASQIETNLSSLQKLSEPENVSGLARGVAFQLVENFGILVRDDVQDDIKALDQEARKQLRRFGVRFGAYHIFIPQLLKPAPTKLLMLLSALQTAKATQKPLHMPAHPGQGLTSVQMDEKLPNNYYQTAGFRKCVGRAVRIDMLERLADLIREVLYWKPKADVTPAAPADSGNIPSKAEIEAEKAAKEAEANGDASTEANATPAEQERPLGAHISGGFTVTPNMMSLVGCSGDEFSNILTTIGYQMKKIDKADDVLEAEKAAAEEGVEVVAFDEVWFPKPRHKNNNRKPNQNKKPFKAKNGKKFDKGNKKPNHKAKPAKAAKPTIAPEDSPFAALMALKDKV